MTKLDKLIEAVDVLRDASYCAGIKGGHNKGFKNGEGRPTRVYREPPSIAKQKEARATIKGYAELKAERDRCREALEKLKGTIPCNKEFSADCAGCNSEDIITKALGGNDE